MSEDNTKDTQTPEIVKDAPEQEAVQPDTKTPIPPVQELVGEPEAPDSSKEEGKQIELAAPADKESANRLGVKESAENADVMSMEKDAENEDENVIAAPPSFFIDTKEHHRIDVDILCSKSDGQVLSVSRTGLDIDFKKDFKFLNHLEEWFEFTLPTYEDMSSYRQRCGIYRKEAQQVIIDRLALRNFLLVWHLKDWSMRDKDGKKVELTQEENGAMSDESLVSVYKMHTTILDVVLTILEKDILLT